MISNARGIAIDADGIIYYTREVGASSWVARLRPGQNAETTWSPMMGFGNAGLRTLRVDSMRKLLFVAVQNYNSVVVIHKDTGRQDTAIANQPGAHGLAIDDQGWLYVSRSDGIIGRHYPDIVSMIGAASTSSVMPSGQRPMGLAFGPGGLLYVGSNNGRIRRMRITNGMAGMIEDYGSFTGSANDLAFDVDWRLYVADSTGTTRRAVSVLPPGGNGTIGTLTPTGLYSGLAFGRGNLACTNLYVADAGGVARLFSGQPLGVNVP